MRGHVYKRGTTWTAVYDEGHDEQGRRRQRSKGGFPTRKAAEAFLASTVSAIGEGSYVAPTRLTAADYLAGWLEEVAETVRPLTLRKYDQVCRLYLVPRLGHLPLQGLRRAHLTALYRSLREGGLAPATVAGVHSVAHRAFADAVAADLLVRNPAALRKAAPKPTKAGELSRRARVWSPRELRTFLEHVEGDRLAALWRLAAMSGMRRGELLGLTWQALDLEAGRLVVDRQLLAAKGGTMFGAPKTARSRRTVALDADTVAALRAHREAQLLERAFLGEGYVDRDLVFAREDGTPIYPARLSEAFGRHVADVRLPRIRLHDLRHTHATHALTSGVPVHVVAARIGDDPALVLRTYSHLLPTSDAEAVERVAALVR
jgi:integrase